MTSLERLCLALAAGAITIALASDSTAAQATPPSAAARWCDRLPRPENAALTAVPVADRWFDVRRAAPGVFAIIEPRQFQEAVAYLVVGTSHALLFDTGIGVRPIRPVVEHLTKLPVTVLNSHTHFDHVGGNWEFGDVRAMETAFTREHMRGMPHTSLASEVAADAFCGGPPVGFDTTAYRARAWHATGTIADGTKFDLGGRTLEVLSVPGHTPDAIALLDRSAGLLWTGDSYYPGSIWLFMPETDLAAYQRSIDRLASLTPTLRTLLPAHNVASASPSQLRKVAQAIRDVRSGKLKGTAPEPGQRLFPFDGFSILVSERALSVQKP